MNGIRFSQVPVPVSALLPPPVLQFICPWACLLCSSLVLYSVVFPQCQESLSHDSEMEL